RRTNISLNPQRFRALLERALAGESVPLPVYRSVLRLRQIPSPAGSTLRLKGAEPFLAMLRGLSGLFRQMGYRGLVLLFDEGESILKGNILQRSRSYTAIDHFLRPPSQARGLFAVFAFTEDFFRCVDSEDYTRAHPSQNFPYFSYNYQKIWNKL